MSKYLITGGQGFVGNYLIKYLLDNYTRIEIYSISHTNSSKIIKGVNYEIIDLLNTSDIERFILRIKPDFIFHLAAMSSVSQSWQNPAMSFSNNINIFINLLEAVRKSGIYCKILSIGSSEVYGIINSNEIPINENHATNPISPYAVARVSQELISKVYIEGFKLKIILTRSFNHIGPGQDIRFAIPNFLKESINRVKQKSIAPIETGDLNIIRDFVDVRDVVVAYDLLIKSGQIGEIYNICSSYGISLKSITDKIKQLTGIKNEFITKSELIRPIDNPIIIGDYSKLKKTVGWKPTISIDESLKEMYIYQLDSND
jgi:GDP-4-dehydro-6-deoxy-D-mannose reductase